MCADLAIHYSYVSGSTYVQLGHFAFVVSDGKLHDLLAVVNLSSTPYTHLPVFDGKGVSRRPKKTSLGELALCPIEPNTCIAAFYTVLISIILVH